MIWPGGMLIWGLPPPCLACCRSRPVLATGAAGCGPARGQRLAAAERPGALRIRGRLVAAGIVCTGAGSGCDLGLRGGCCKGHWWLQNWPRQGKMLGMPSVDREKETCDQGSVLQSCSGVNRDALHNCCTLPAAFLRNTIRSDPLSLPWPTLKMMHLSQHPQRMVPDSRLRHDSQPCAGADNTSCSSCQ